MFYSYLMNILIFKVSRHTFHDFSIHKVIFHGFPDVENFYFKFHNFPDFSRIYTNPGVDNR